MFWVSSKVAVSQDGKQTMFFLSNHCTCCRQNATNVSILCTCTISNKSAEQMVQWKWICFSFTDCILTFDISWSCTQKHGDKRVQIKLIHENDLKCVRSYQNNKHADINWKMFI